MTGGPSHDIAKDTMPDDRSTEVDAMLRSFLEAEKRREDGGVTLERIYEAQQRLWNLMMDHEKKDDDRFAELYKQNASFDHRLKHVEADVEAISSRYAPSPAALLPPMRSEITSSHVFEDATLEVTREVGQTFKHLESLSPGPGVNAPAEELEAKVGVIFTKKIEELKEDLSRRQERQRLAAFDAAAAAKLADDEAKAKKKQLDADREAEKKKDLRAKTIAGIIASLVVAGLCSLSAMLYGRAVEHNSAFAEGRASAPATVVVPAPIPTFFDAGSVYVIPVPPDVTTHATPRPRP